MAVLTICFFDPGIIFFRCSFCYISEIDCCSEWVNVENVLVVSIDLHGCSYVCTSQKHKVSSLIVKVPRTRSHADTELVDVCSLLLDTPCILVHYIRLRKVFIVFICILFPDSRSPAYSTNIDTKMKICSVGVYKSRGFVIRRVILLGIKPWPVFQRCWSQALRPTHKETRVRLPSYIVHNSNSVVMLQCLVTLTLWQHSNMPSRKLCGDWRVMRTHLLAYVEGVSRQELLMKIDRIPSIVVIVIFPYIVNLSPKIQYYAYSVQRIGVPAVYISVSVSCIILYDPRLQLYYMSGRFQLMLCFGKLDSLHRLCLFRTEVGVHYGYYYFKEGKMCHNSQCSSDVSLNSIWMSLWSVFIVFLILGKLDRKSCHDSKPYRSPKVARWCTVKATNPNWDEGSSYRPSSIFPVMCVLHANPCIIKLAEACPLSSHLEMWDVVVYNIWQLISGHMVLVTLIIIVVCRRSWTVFSGVAAASDPIPYSFKATDSVVQQHPSLSIVLLHLPYMAHILFTAVQPSSLIINRSVCGILGPIQCENYAETLIGKDRDKSADMHQQVFLTAPRAYFPCVLDSDVTDWVYVQLWQGSVWRINSLQVESFARVLNVLSSSSRTFVGVRQLRRCLLSVTVLSVNATVMSTTLRKQKGTKCTFDLWKHKMSELLEDKHSEFLYSPLMFTGVKEPPNQEDSTRFCFTIFDVTMRDTFNTTVKLNWWFFSGVFLCSIACTETRDLFLFDLADKALFKERGLSHP